MCLLSACGASSAGAGAQEDAGGADAGIGQMEGPTSCGDEAECWEPFKCRFDTCVPELGTCSTNADCPGDSYCSDDGECLPYGVPPEVVNDPGCQRPEIPGDVQPTIQCEWTGPSEGPTQARIYSSPIVADLNLDGDLDQLRPSVIATTWADVGGVRTGVLRIWDGRTCEEVTSLRTGELDPLLVRPGYGTQWAVGDLDGDVAAGGHPELVGMHTQGTSGTSPLALYALRVDTTGAEPVLERMWQGRDCDSDAAFDEEPPINIGDNQANFGPGLWDLDDDGSPEILIDSIVFDASGCRLSQSESFTQYLTHGRMNAIADVDADGTPELVSGDRIAGWNTATTEWVTESYFAFNAVDHKLGHVAVADLGDYSTLPGQTTFPNALPEVIVVSAQNPGSFNPSSTGTIRVQTLDGTVVFGPIDLHHEVSAFGGHGGAPTASDFDGDGQVELAAAANEFYVVYDPDCQAALAGASPVERPGGRCDRAPAMADLPDGILWAQPSSDFSSSGTGSSIFDFNADGRAEAVYGDECFLRVYDGGSGDVIFSAAANSGTGFELPTIVDADGDFATEIVVARSNNGPACGCPDPLFASAVGCESGTYTRASGFFILRDPEDLWAASRPIWNQHAYSVTNVTDDARIPRTSELAINWRTPGLNNFRQNTQGGLGVLDLADLTVVFDEIADLCGHAAGITAMSARVCNRGTANVSDGARVDFVESIGGAASVVCTTATTGILEPGECERVTCTGTVTDATQLFVQVDPLDEIADCTPDNNDGAGLNQICVE